MVTQKFSVTIDARPEKVWEALWKDGNYQRWTAVFHPGSYMEASSLTKGAPVRFLGPEGSGIYSAIESVEPNKSIIFEHRGIVKGHVNQPQDEETDKWSGSREKYFLEEVEGMTRLTVELDVAEGHESQFAETFPKAINVVKEISEE